MKNYNKDNPPIDCKCGCEETEERNIYKEDINGIFVKVEYTLHCKKCGAYLGTYEYGHWSY